LAVAAHGNICVRDTNRVFMSSCEPCLQSQSTYCQAGMQMLRVGQNHSYTYIHGKLGREIANYAVIYGVYCNPTYCNPTCCALHMSAVASRRMYLHQRDTSRVFMQAMFAITKHVLSSRNACVGCCKPTEIPASETQSVLFRLISIKCRSLHASYASYHTTRIVMQ